MIRVALLVVVAALPAGCFHGDEARVARLFDGSDPRPVPAPLDVRHAVVGRVVVARVGDLGAKGRACLRMFAPARFPAQNVVVRRIGVSSETITVRDRAAVYGCDDTVRSFEDKGPWCGGSVGMLFGGRLRDPRVGIVNCRNAEGEPIGFAWITPSPRARWVAVEERGYTELYEVAGRLPVRVSTSGVRTAASKVEFRYREYAADGTEVAEHTMEAGVAG